MSDRVKLIIKDKKFIPTVGQGPILNPISVTQNQLKLFRKLGLNIQLIGDNKVSIPTPVVEEVKEETTIKTEEVKEEIVEETVVEEVEVVQEEKKEETDMDIESMNKDQLKKELDKRGIRYKYKDTVEELRTLLSKNL